MRVDEAHHVLGLRLNVWTAIIVFVLAVVYIVISAKVRPGREEIVEPAAVSLTKDGDEDRRRPPGETGSEESDFRGDRGRDRRRGEADAPAPEADGTPQKARQELTLPAPAHVAKGPPDHHGPAAPSPMYGPRRCERARARVRSAAATTAASTNRPSGRACAPASVGGRLDDLLRRLDLP